MSSAGGVQTCQHAAAVTEIKAQDQIGAQHYTSQQQSYASSHERVQTVNHDYLSGMRESLFRLLSKVPIQIETVRPANSTSTGYATAGHQQLASSLDQRQAGLARRQRQPSDHLRDPLVIKYYHDKSLADIIDLHFGCSLMSSTHHSHGRWQASSTPEDASKYSNQHCQQYHQLVSSNLPVSTVLNDAAKSDERKSAARRPLPSQRTASNKSLQRAASDKFNGQTKNVVPASAANGNCRSRQTIQRRALRLQQQHQRLLPVATSQAIACNGGGGGHVTGGVVPHEDAMQSYRLARPFDDRHPCPTSDHAHRSAMLGDVVPSCYDEPQAHSACQHQDQFVFVGNLPSSVSCMQDSSSQRVLYAPAHVVDHPQLDYNQQQQYQHYNQFSTPTADEAQQQQFNSYGALAQSEVSASHEYHPHAAHTIHCDSQHQAHTVQQHQQSGSALVWQPQDQAHQHSEHFSASHQHHNLIQCGSGALPPLPPPVDHQHTFIHFNVTDLNQMIEQQQQMQQHGPDGQVVSKSEYFQKNPQACYGDDRAPIDNRGIPRHQLIYHHHHHHNPQPLEAMTSTTAPLQPSDGQAHSRQGSSLESNSSSSSSSSCSSASSSSSSIRRSAGPATPLVDTNAPAHLDDCLHLEQINPRFT